MAARRDTRRWARLVSWIVGAAVWLWLIYFMFVQGGSAYRIEEGDQYVIDILQTSILVAVATFMAVLALFLVRIIGWGAARLKLRFEEGE